MTRKINVLLVLTVSLAALIGAPACGRRGSANAGLKPVGKTAKGGKRGSRSPTLARVLPQNPLASLGLRVGTLGPDGRPVTIACQTCHNHMARIAPGDPARAWSKFHGQIRLSHVGTCQTCHRAPTFADFNLADGRAVPLGDVMRLCGQCHGKRLDEYLNGAHGGMRGFWDKRRGPRQRNHCLDCHDPHQPRIRQVLPAKRPKY